MGCCHSKVRSKEEAKREGAIRLIPENIVLTISNTDEQLSKDEIVNRALEIFLPDFDFYYSPEGRLEKDPVKIMLVKNNTGVSLNPNEDGTILNYGSSPTNYKLHLGRNKRIPTETIFVYRSEENNGDNTVDTLTSPYHPDNIIDKSPVPCAKAVDITEALKDPNPVRAVVKVLREYFPDLKEEKFVWNKDGSDNSFTIATSIGNPISYWEGIDESNEGPIHFTENNADKLELMLEDVIDLRV